MSSITWRRTHLARSLIRCDHCGTKADAVHFLSDGEYPRGEGLEAVVEAVFACVRHDPEGYYRTLDDWFNADKHVHEDLEGKTWGPAAIAALDRRFDKILREAARQDRR